MRSCDVLSQAFVVHVLAKPSSINIKRNYDKQSKDIRCVSGIGGYHEQPSAIRTRKGANKGQRNSRIPKLCVIIRIVRVCLKLAYQRITHTFDLM